MSKMLSKVFIEKALDIANNFKTLYVMGCFGAPMNNKNKDLFVNTYHWNYNNKTSRVKMIQSASSDTFGFDCVNLIKGILWGWSGDITKSYGGAKYLSNGVPDHGANQFILDCVDVSTDFSSIIPGEMLWCSGHAGIYVGNGLAVECTPAWKNCVQITSVSNIKKCDGFNNRKWTKHGKIPWVDYSDYDKAYDGFFTFYDLASNHSNDDIVDSGETKIDYARYFDKSIAGRYRVTASALNVRAGAGTNKPIINILKNGDIVNCYGYYSTCKNTKWFYILHNGKVGFVSSIYLAKH